MESTRPIVRTLLFAVGAALTALGTLMVLTIVVNPEWWNLLTDEAGFGGLLGDGFLSRVSWWLQSLSQGLQIVVWGLVAMGIGHALSARPQLPPQQQTMPPPPGI